MNKEKVFAFGTPYFDRKGRDIDYNVTAFRVDMQTKEAAITLERGASLETIKLSLFYLEDIGVFDLSKLNKYIRK